jgi:hypothetical protein
MTTTDDKWSTERVQPPQARKGVPRWLWGCGIGCGLFALLGLVLALLGVREVRRMADPERQWARLGEVVSVARRPADCEIMGGPGLLTLLPGFHGVWSLIASDGSWRADVQAFEAGAEEEFSSMLTGEGVEEVSVPWIGIGFYDPEPGTLSVQGRELRTLRFRTGRLEEAAEPAGEADRKGWLARQTEEIASQHASAGVNIDVTPAPPGAYLVLIQYTTPGRLERIGDDELSAFLDHFDLGAR